MAGSKGLISVKDLVSAEWRNRHPNISEEGLIGYIQVERPGYNYLRGGADYAGEKENDNVRDGKLAAKKYGATYIVRRENIEWWLEQQKLLAES